MQFIEIDGVRYNLAFLISLEYQQDNREKTRKGEYLDKGRTFKTGEIEFNSVLKIKFAESKEIILRAERADEGWRNLLEVLKLDPVAKLSTQDPRNEPKE